MTLSVIVPILNESALLPQLFASLSAQSDIVFEVVLVDGGSTDGTLRQAEALAAVSPFACRIVHSEAGRGRQLNAGAKHSCGDWLLFLHADSTFADGRALATAVTELAAKVALSGHERMAGRFSLHFQRASAAPTLAYYYLERKARLDRPGCIHGDQGYLLSRNFFLQVGPFDESLGFLEDNRLAEVIDKKGRWLLLPVALFTSPRRFEVEGFARRQALSALIMTLAAVGRNDLLGLLPGIYRQQGKSRRLNLLPFWQALSQHLKRRPWRERWLLWYRCGAYMVANAWQLAFWWDVRRAFRRGLAAGDAACPWLSRFDRCLFPVIDHPLGYALTALLTRCGLGVWSVLSRLLHRR